MPISKDLTQWNVYWMPTRCRMLYLPYFIEFWKESYHLAFSPPYYRKLAVAHDLQWGWEGVHLFTALFPGADTALVMIGTSWMFDTDPRGRLLTVKMDYLEKLRLRRVKWYIRGLKSLTGGSKFKPSLAPPYLGSICRELNCQELFPGVTTPASLSTSVSRATRDVSPSPCVFSGTRCLPTHKSGSSWCWSRNLSHVGQKWLPGDTQGEWSRGGHRTDLAFNAWMIGGLCSSFFSAFGRNDVTAPSTLRAISWWFWDLFWD